MYQIEFSEGVETDLKKIRIYTRKIILDAVEQKLVHRPNIETKNRKVLVNLIPPFESIPPIRELRVGDFRVFYDVDQDAEKVYVRAVRKKPPHSTAEEIL
ncbi:MAG: type II toxin-antitoxin system RelE/ParE family toxin [Spirochaetaceae bacterium]|nr:MAG: type II toxin-antitoxin system RelE/ParE family toxin [Spirochaetaceae bacterium]